MQVHDLIESAKEGTRIRIMAKDRLEEIGQSEWYNELLPKYFMKIPYYVLTLKVEEYEVVDNTILIR